MTWWSNGNIFRVTGHLWGEFTGHRWLPRTKGSDAELWCFLWSAPLICYWIETKDPGTWQIFNSSWDQLILRRGSLPLVREDVICAVFGIYYPTDTNALTKSVISTVDNYTRVKYQAAHIVPLILTTFYRDILTTYPTLQHRFLPIQNVIEIG